MSGRDLLEAIRGSAGRWTNRIALKADGGRGKQYTYGEACELSARLAAGLKRIVSEEMPTVGLLSENCPEWAIAYLGIVGSGRTVVPIDANVKPAELKAMIPLSGVRCVFASTRFAGILRVEFPDVRVYSLDQESEDSWLPLLSEDPVESIIDPEKTAVLIHTSGTTGSPSAVMLSHRNILSNLEGIRPVLPFDSSDVFLSVLPLHHTLEATCGLLAPLTSGATVVYARSLKSREILEDIARNKVTVMCGVPQLFEKMCGSIRRGIDDAPLARRLAFRALFALTSMGWSLRKRWGKPLFASLRKKAGLASIRLLVSGGAAMPAETARFFNFIGIDLVQGYGMTECSPVVSVNRIDDIRFGSVGPPLPNLDVRIDSPDEHGVGEILIKGPSTTAGYRNNPQKTSELLRGGWLHTGDLGRLHEGHLWITGRLKNIIVSAAGKNIYPEELEEHLMASPYISEAIVFGQQRETRHGEEVRALIVPDMDQLRVEYGLSAHNPDADKVRSVLTSHVAEVNRRIADYKRIAGFDVQFEELERTSSRKLKRFVYVRPASAEKGKR